MEEFLSREGRQKFYHSREWRALREYKLSKNPICEVCDDNGYIEGATCVDHKIDIKDDPNLRLEYSNLTSMCWSCHSRKTFKQTRKDEPKKTPGGIQNLWKIETKKLN